MASGQGPAGTPLRMHGDDGSFGTIPVPDAISDGATPLFPGYRRGHGRRTPFRGRSAPPGTSRTTRERGGLILFALQICKAN